MPIALQDSGNGSRLQQVSEKVIPLTEKTEEKTSPLDKIATDMILFGIKTLGQKTLVAISQIFTLCATFSAFILWYRTLPTPTAEQLVGLGLYAAFILVLEVIRRRK